LNILKDISIKEIEFLLIAEYQAR